MDDAKAIEILNDAIKNRGHFDRICPESLTDLREAADEWGSWGGVSTHAYTGGEVRQAYSTFMASLRALLG